MDIDTHRRDASGVAESPALPGPAVDRDLDARCIEVAIVLATASVARGGGPFGAVVVRAGEVIGQGQNRVTLDLDPSAHAEVEAIRAACRAVGDFSLPGATLYSSCEPCPLCLCAALWARVERVVYAADRGDAAHAGFDDREFDDLFTRARSTWPIAVESLAMARSDEPFAAWAAFEGRTAY